MPFREHMRQSVRGWRDRAVGRLTSGSGPSQLVVDAAEVAASKSFSVIVPVHDAPTVFSRCLDGLETHGHDAEIVLVDDGSKLDETRKLFAAAPNRLSNCRVIRHESPLGHSRACEAGVRESSRPYLCLLNSDAIVTTRTWAGILDVFNATADVAVAGPATSSAPTFQQVAAAHGHRFDWTNAEIDAFALRYTNLYRNRFLVRALGKAVMFAHEVNGFAFFIRRAAWDAMGGFHADLDDYGNESELCQRLLRAGYRLAVTRRSYVHHFGKQSYGGEGADAAERSATYRDVQSAKYLRIVKESEGDEAAPPRPSEG